MKFETWLKEQKFRDDAIGDLACDFIRCLGIMLRAPFSNQVYYHRKPSGWVTIEDCFELFKPCYQAEETLLDARKEFEELKVVE